MITEVPCIAALASGASLPVGIVLGEASILSSLARSVTLKSSKIFTAKQKIQFNLAACSK